MYDASEASEAGNQKKRNMWFPMTGRARSAAQEVCKRRMNSTLESCRDFVAASRGLATVQFLTSPALYTDGRIRLTQAAYVGQDFEDRFHTTAVPPEVAERVVAALQEAATAKEMSTQRAEEIGTALAEDAANALDIETARERAVLVEMHAAYDRRARAQRTTALVQLSGGHSSGEDEDDSLLPMEVMFPTQWRDASPPRRRRSPSPTLLPARSPALPAAPPEDEEEENRDMSWSPPAVGHSCSPPPSQTPAGPRFDVRSPLHEVNGQTPMLRPAARAAPTTPGRLAW